MQAGGGGEYLGHYRIVRKLGEGAMGAVFEGLDESLNMKVALKVLSPAIAEDESGVVRFEREARSAANLKHPNIAHVFFVGRTPSNLPFYAMEFIAGYSMADIIDKNMIITGADMVTLMTQSAKALQFAGEKGILHRDVKPGNIMIETNVGAKLVDFGLAKPAEGDSNLTTTGVALGTPNYISPEQARAVDIDFRADMYSLGITFFEFLVGYPPYIAETPVGVIMKHIQDPVPDVQGANPQYPKPLCRAIEKMMAKDAGDRFQTYDELLEILADLAHSHREFMEARLTYCDHCQCNVFLALDGTCTRCHEIIEEPPREETYYAAQLVSLVDSQAQARVAQYLRLTTNRSELAVMSMLNRLPVVLNPKLPSDKARKLQKLLYDMGAEVTLRKVGVATVQGMRRRKEFSLFTATGSFPAGTEARKAAGDKPTVAVKPPSKGRERRVPLAAVVGIIGAVLALAAGLGWYLLSGGEPDAVATAVAHQTPDQAEPSATPPAAPPEGEPAPATDAANPPPADEGTEPPAEAAQDPGAEDLRVSTFRDEQAAVAVRGLNLEDNGLLEIVAKAAQQQRVRIMMLLALGEMPPAELVLDATRTFGQMPGPLGLGVLDDGQGLVLWAGGLDTESPAFNRSLVAKLGQGLVRARSHSHAPLWLETGFALYLANSVYPDSFNAAATLRGHRDYLDDELWEQSFTHQRPSAYGQAAGFVTYLAQQYGADTLLQLADRLARDEDLDAAFSPVYGFTRTQLLATWFATARRP